MKKPNPDVIINCGTCLIKHYLAKGYYIVEKGTNQLSFLPNDLRLRINLNNILDKDIFMGKESNFCRRKHHQTITYSERYATQLPARSGS